MTQRSKTALVLAGGGVAGAVYEIGALCAIEDILTRDSVNDMDIYVGTSAGALISSCLVNGITPRTLMTVLSSDVFGIRQLEPRHLFSFNFSNVAQRGVNLPSALASMLQLIFSARHHASVLDILEELAMGLPNGFYDTTGLEQYLRSTLTNSGYHNDFRELERELAIIATDLDSGQRAIFGEPPLDAIPISQAVCASAAMPLFYSPVRINGHDYIDGGIRGTASLDVAIERGAQLILCINPLVPFDNSSRQLGKNISDEGIQRIGNQVFRTFIHAGLHYHLKQIRRRHPDVDIILIEPSSDDPVMFAENTMRYISRLSIARHAFETVATYLVEHYDYYRAILSRHGVDISINRITKTLEALSQAGKDPRAVQAAMLHQNLPAPPPPDGLDQVLSELERLLDWFNKRPT